MWCDDSSKDDDDVFPRFYELLYSTCLLLSNLAEESEGFIFAFGLPVTQLIVVEETLSFLYYEFFVVSFQYCSSNIPCMCILAFISKRLMHHVYCTNLALLIAHTFH